MGSDRDELMPEFYVYWISTALLSVLYLASAAIYVTKRDWVRQVLAELGFQASYLIPFMIIIKVLGPAAILSRVSVPLSDLAYAGIFFHLLLSGLAHVGCRRRAGPGAAEPRLGAQEIRHGRHRRSVGQARPKSERPMARYPCTLENAGNL